MFKLKDFKQRSYEKELIDLGEPNYTPEEYNDCLEKLGSVGRLLGGDRATLKGFSNLNPYSILDVGCGGGFTVNLLSKKFTQCTVTGIDMSEKAINFCHTRHRKENRQIHFKHHANKGIIADENSVDIITTTLVCHHMNDEELVEFLKQAKSVAKQEVIINDLHRHPIAYFFYFFMAPVLFRNRLISKDGLLSIKRGFIHSEWKKYLKLAGLQKNDYKISWYFPFRYIVRIQCNQ
ncbi:MAG: methyltransferase domain-containing protein [Gammaproteobacteria bacterium]|nr:methyltransferase domain-containing protein [Gammaproteobacteria bacterium]